MMLYREGSRTFSEHNFPIIELDLVILIDVQSVYNAVTRPKRCCHIKDVYVYSVS